MSKLHLRQPGFTHSACGLFLNILKEFRNKKTSNLKHICNNKLDKACFAYDAAYYDNKR